MKPTFKTLSGGKLRLRLKGCFPRLKIWADSGYKKGRLLRGVKAELGWEVEIVETSFGVALRGVQGPGRGSKWDWEQIRPSGFYKAPIVVKPNGPSPGFPPLGVGSPKTMRGA